MPGLEKYILHRLSELDESVRKSYAEFDYKRIFAALNQFMTVDLSAFYFDIRKDALYCEPISSVTRKACLTVIDQVFRATVTWLAPMLCFTAEEAWLSRFPGAGSVHLEPFPAIPAAWRDEALAHVWGDIRRVRRVVTGALEIERANKRIGSSLEAAPVIYIADPALLQAHRGRTRRRARRDRHGRDRHHVGRDRRARGRGRPAHSASTTCRGSRSSSARPGASNARGRGKSSPMSGPIRTIRT